MSRTNSNNKKTLRRTLLILAALLACAVAAYLVNAEQYKTKFVPGTLIDGIDASEQTVDALGDEMTADAKNYTLTMKFLNDVTETISSADVDLEYDCKSELQSILDGQNRFAWILGFFGQEQSYAMQTQIAYSAEKLAAVIGSLPELQVDNVREPKDAKLKLGSDGLLSIVPETNGNSIDEEKLLEAAGDAIVSRNAKVDVVMADGIYEQPAVRSDDPELNATKDSLNAMLGTTVTYTLSDGSERVLDSDTLKEWLVVDDEGGYSLSDDVLRERAAEYIAGIAKDDNDYGYYRRFASTNFGIIRMGTESLHGHSLDQEAMTEELVSDLKSHTDASHEMTYDAFVDAKDPRFGGTYVEVDVLNQRVYYYIDYELYYDCSCVTGTEGSHSTPSGIFSIISKENGRTLEGYNSDGTVAYTAYVEYWMCFYPHYGLHDASWRDYFGGETYLYDGSHGCVNLSRYSAGIIYNALDYDTPVIVFRGQDDSVMPEDEINPNTEDSLAD